MPYEDQITALNDERLSLVSQSRALLDRAESERRSLNQEEQNSWDAQMARLDEVRSQIDRMHRINNEERSASQIQPRATTPAATIVPTPSNRMASEDRPFGVWLRNGLSGMTAEQMAAMTAHYSERALQADPLTSGGFLRPDQEFVARLIQKVDDVALVRSLATVIPLDSADSIGVPTLETDIADADWTTELATGSEDSSMAFGKRELRPNPLAKSIKVSNKILRQSRIDPEALVAERMGYKFGVAQENGFLNGTGVSQPLGVFTASASGISTGRDSLTGSATDFTADGIILAKYQLKPQYMRSARWMFHRAGVRRIRQLKDSQNQYLWQPGLASDAPDRILELPYDMSEFAPSTFTSGLYVGILGVWSFYWIVESMGFQMQRLVELYAGTNQIGFIGRQEIDGAPVLEEAFVRLKTN